AVSSGPYGDHAGGCCGQWEVIIAEALGCEGPSYRGQIARQHIGADGFSGHGRQQDSIAMVSGCDYQPVDPTWTQHWSIVPRTRTESDPSLGHRKLLDARHCTPGPLDKPPPP